MDNSKTDAGNNPSVWEQGAAPPRLAPLRDSLSADVCVIGAGIAGLSTAYLLAREGRSVIVLDDGPVGGGETGRTTAHLSYALDDGYYEIESMHGEDRARLAAESHRAAIDRIENIVRGEDIEYEFRRVDGYLFAPSDGSLEELDREADAARRAGISDLEVVERAPIPLWDTRRCLRFPNQAQFDPLKYLHGLVRAILRDGGRIFTGTHADTVTGASRLTVSTAGGATVEAEHVVMATNSPVWDSYGLFTTQSAYRTYAIGARVAPGAVRTALYWDTSDPYHYVRLQHGTSAGEAASQGGDESDVLIVGGEDHKTGQAADAEERFARLEAWTRERFPIQSVDFRWSGQVLEPVDGMAFIGRHPLSLANLYVVTGDSGHGMTHGTIAGILLTDLIQGRSNPWADLYDPARITLRALSQYATENLNVVAQYGDWVTEADIDSRDQLAPGSGATIRDGASKTAVYREESGAYYECSAVCPHLGCIVNWNDSEKSWDCPCHGSRFDAHGVVLNGPANRNLERSSSRPLISAAGVGLRTAALLGTNIARQFLLLRLR